jgi:hypothetical protein
MGIIKLEFDGKTAIALRKAKEFMKRAHWISGVDYGYKYIGNYRTKRLGIRFHVKKKFPKKLVSPSRLLPASINGIDCDVVQSKFELHTGIVLNPRTGVTPIVTGISIGNGVTNTAGTLGTFVIDNTTNELCLLSNWHILYNTTEIGRYSIVQPASCYSAGSLHSTIAVSSRYIDPSTGYDAAIATVNPHIEYGIGTSIGTNLPSDFADPDHHMDLYMIGAMASQSVLGTTDGTFGVYQIEYPSLGRIVNIRGFSIVPAEQNSCFCQDGDSGALWVEKGNDNAVGLHVGGSGGNNSNFAIACNAREIFRALNIRLYNQPSSILI